MPVEIERWKWPSHSFDTNHSSSVDTGPIRPIRPISTDHHTDSQTLHISYQDRHAMMRREQSNTHR